MVLSSWLWACLMLTTVFAIVTHAESTLWGTYRPQLLFGLRPRMPQTLLTGFMYYSPTSIQGGAPTRHLASVNPGPDYFRWKYHDGRNFGIQEIVDHEHNYLLETSFVKSGHQDGAPGHWGVRIRGTVLDESKPANIVTYYYMGSENSRFPFYVTEQGEARCSVLGGVSMRTKDAPENRPLEGFERMAYAALSVDVRETWRGQDIILEEHIRQKQESLKRPTDALDHHMVFSNRTESNTTFFAVQKAFEGNFSYDIFLDSGSSSPDAKLHPENLTHLLASYKKEHDEHFESRFGLIKSGMHANHVEAAREITSQLIGGIGYYYGESLVDRRPLNDSGMYLHDMHGAMPKPEGPHSLLTATPSRSFFPRGFYWDEGFHLLHIGAWDAELASMIFEAWTHLMDKNGWVAREQILGEEARSQVPREFQTQYPQHANPPTLIFGLNSMLDEYHSRVKEAQEDLEGVDYIQRADLGNMDRMHKKLESLYPHWKRHYEWFRRTQRGQIRQWGREATSRYEAYRWRGRSPTHVLTSGLDDYPRASTPHIGELHVDLLSWMGLFASSMAQFAETLGNDDDALEYRQQAEDIAANVIDLHWNDEERLFCDASVGHDDESYFECHPGYVSLFPFLTQLLKPESEQLSATLDLLSDHDALWSPNGLRSLSKAHPLFGEDEDYWRGAIWLPINYMALRALHHYSQGSGKNADRCAILYTDLRLNIIHTVLDEYERTGYTWEQYDEETGHGRRNHPFTGWTSLVVLIMAEKYHTTYPTLS